MNTNIFKTAITRYEEVLNVCNKKIERLTHPEIYGCCLCKCNSIVINKERMMTVTTNESHMTTFEFSPLYPTYFSPEAANRIVKEDSFKNIFGKEIEMEIIGESEYYRLLKDNSEKSLETLRRWA